MDEEMNDLEILTITPSHTQTIEIHIDPRAHDVAIEDDGYTIAIRPRLIRSDDYEEE